MRILNHGWAKAPLGLWLSLIVIICRTLSLSLCPYRQTYCSVRHFLARPAKLDPSYLIQSSLRLSLPSLCLRLINLLLLRSILIFWIRPKHVSLWLVSFFSMFSWMVSLIFYWADLSRVWFLSIKYVFLCVFRGLRIYLAVSKWIPIIVDWVQLLGFHSWLWKVVCWREMIDNI